MRAFFIILITSLSIVALSGCGSDQEPRIPDIELTLDQQHKYEASCKVCHETASSGAIMKGDTAAWQEVLDKPMAEVLQGVINGINGMPPLGQCFDCNEEDLKALVYFLAQ